MRPKRRAFREPLLGRAQRYLLRSVAVAFIAALTALTLVVWVNQALRELNLVTSTNQTFLVFLTVTGLSLPLLVAVIAPMALFIAILFALNRHGGDSELIVMSAAGLSPTTLLRPVLYVAVLVSLFVGTMTLWAIPMASKGVRDLMTRVRADVVANFLREGQFMTFDKQVTFHFRERAGDALMGVFIYDRRDERQPVAYTAERGRTLQSDGRSYLVLEKGTAQRLGSTERGSGIVTFESYAIDLSQLSDEAGIVAYRPRERSTWELLSPDTSDPLYRQQAGRFVSELHDRLSAPLYPIVLALIAFAAMGAPRTTRQGRGVAILIAIVATFAVRVAGFALTSRLARSPSLAPLVYLVPIGAGAIAYAHIAGAERLLGSVLHRMRAVSRPPRVAEAAE